MKHLQGQDTESFIVRVGTTAKSAAADAGAAGESAALGAQKIDQSIAYMREHLNKPLQVAKLAALVNVSASHYFALFKRRTGCAPIDFFIRLRMHQACRLLGGTALSVKEVAATLGYEDPFYFSRMFKSVVQVAPSEYRMLAQDPRPAHSQTATAALADSSTESRRRGTAFGRNKPELATSIAKAALVTQMMSACAAMGA